MKKPNLFLFFPHPHQQLHCLLATDLLAGCTYTDGKERKTADESAGHANILVQKSSVQPQRAAPHVPRPAPMPPVNNNLKSDSKSTPAPKPDVGHTGTASEDAVDEPPAPPRTVR